MKKGMVFGVFDGLHEGHKYFLREAKSLCDMLLVVVTPDKTVEALKGRLPKHAYEERVRTIAAFDPLLTVIPGDAILGEWGVLKTHQLDLLIVGYDQKALEEELRPFQIPITMLSPHKPNEYKSSIVNQGY